MALLRQVQSLSGQSTPQTGKNLSSSRVDVLRQEAALRKTQDGVNTIQQPIISATSPTQSTSGFTPAQMQENRNQAFVNAGGSLPGYSPSGTTSTSSSSGYDLSSQVKDLYSAQRNLAAQQEAAAKAAYDATVEEQKTALKDKFALIEENLSAIYKPQRGVLERSIGAIERDASISEAIKGTARGTRTAEQQRIREDIANQRRDALAAEESIRRDLLIAQAEGQSTSIIEGKAKQLEAARAATQKIEQEAATFEAGLREDIFASNLKLREQAQQNQFAQQRLDQQLQNDFQKIQFQAAQDTQNALLNAGLKREEIAAVQSQIDSTSSKLFGALIRKDGTFVTDKDGNKITIPKDQQLFSSVAQQGNVAIPSGAYDFIPGATGGFNLNVQEGDIGGQCGKFANDVLGKKVFGDSFEQKMSQINSNIPIPGAAFIMKTDSRYGHVGIVESVNFDGSINVVESNLYNQSNPETISRRTISQNDPAYSSIVGYYIPPNAITEKQVALSQIRNGKITDTDVSKLRSQAAQEGWLNELNLELNSPENESVDESTASKYNTELGINQRTFNQIIGYRQQIGYGNQAFQGLGQDIQQFQKWLELGDRLQRTKTNWDTFQSIGGGLRGFIDFPTNILTAAFQGVTGIAPTQERELLNELNRDAGRDLAEFAKSISGAAISDREFERLKELVPNTGMDDAKFNQALNASIEAYNASANLKAQSFGFQNIDQLKRAIQSYGSMPRSLNEAKYFMTEQNNEISKWGYDDATESIYSNNFIPQR